MAKRDSNEIKKVLKDEGLRMPHGYEVVIRKTAKKAKKTKPKKKKG